MAMPRPVDIVLESSTLAFGGGQYSPVDDTGCVVVHTKDFAFLTVKTAALTRKVTLPSHGGQ